MTTTPNYGTAQWLLYQTGRQLIANGRLKQVEFLEFSASYTDEFFDSLEAEIDAAEILPTEEARALTHSELLQELKPLFRITQRKFMYLKEYVRKAFAKEFWEMNWNSMGWAAYSTEMNWAQAKNMYSQALQYIVSKRTQLLANANMPAGFEAGYIAAVEAYNTKLAAFEAAETAAKEGTDEKVAANNAVYEKIINTICEAGQTIFADDDPKKGEFSFEKVSEMIRPTGPAGLKGVVKENGVPQPGLIVELENGNKSVITDAEGAFDMGHNLASGKDTIVVKNGDEILMEEEVTIPPGVLVREDIDLPTAP